VKKWRVAAFVARDHGWEALQSLHTIPNVEVAAVATHRFLPRNEDPKQGPRPDFSRFVDFANRAECPLLSVDSRAEQQQFENQILKLPYDLILSVSWRRWIPNSLVERALLGGINIHRGRLPNYAGAEPIKQALLKGERRITVTAHQIVEEIDGGPILATAHLDQLPPSHWTLEARVAFIKKSLTPLFSLLTKHCIQQLTSAERSTARPEAPTSV